MEFENFFNQGGFLAVETKYSESFDPIPQLKQQWQLAQALIARGYLVFMVPALNVRFVSRRKANCYRCKNLWAGLGRSIVYRQTRYACPH